MRVFILTTLLAVGTVFSASAFAKENAVGIDVQKADKNVKREVRRSSRKVQDKTCELFHSKADCAAQRAKHKAQNAADDAGAAVKN